MRCVPRWFRPAVWLSGSLVAGCYEGLEEERDIATDVQRALDADQKRQRCDQIKVAAAQRGITNPLVIAGVAHHESGLAQCWSELTWACQGPWSNDCGGPTMAGAGDGSCALQEGGLGMFQLDAGTHAETLAHYGDVTTVLGNVDAGIDTIIYKLSVCPSSAGLFGSTQQVIDFINSAQPGTANYDTFMTTMAWCYNGCAPSYQTCDHGAVKAAYEASVNELLWLFGDAYWDAVPPPLGPAGTTSCSRVGQNSDGRLEVFVRGSDEAIYHRWQIAPNEQWSQWSNLGGMMEGDPVVAANEDGRLELFTVNEGDVVHRWQMGDGTWSGHWIGMGAQGIVGEPAVAPNVDGRLEVFIRGWDDQLWHTWQASPNAPFVEDWYHLGAGFVTDPVVSVNADGRLELFAVGDDQQLWHRFQLSPGGKWSGWVSLQGTWDFAPAVARNADGRLEVFSTGQDGSVYHRWQEDKGGWSTGWASLGAQGIVGTPAVGSNADGRIEIVIRSWDGQLWHKWQTAPNSPFSEDWVHFGKHTTSDPELARNADGRLEVFVRGGDGALYHRWQVAPSESWGGWVSLGGELASF